jgi:hypothetical protein
MSRDHQRESAMGDGKDPPSFIALTLTRTALLALFLALFSHR